ncbi:hypothetical protein AB0F11_01970 [Streptomyces sp. NPDC032472]|uniref:hypothetical protein n=1 Tax=Streptomyces sp. NPDC032472 TaxID=3155018 RepID=UPI0033EA9F9E
MIRTRIAQATAAAAVSLTAVLFAAASSADTAPATGTVLASSDSLGWGSTPSSNSLGWGSTPSSNSLGWGS